ncbi:MAG: hypothetical protein E7247_12695 [Paenibacillaceae bacterium]|nr:hypothetical protein [Paenibacillaceae bacterium]
MIYLRNRYYTPETGRFTTEDSARNGLNYYAYCLIKQNGLRNFILYEVSLSMNPVYDKRTVYMVFQRQYNNAMADNLSKTMRYSKRNLNVICNN